MSYLPKASRLMYSAAFALLGGFGGVGIAMTLRVVLTIGMSRERGDSLVAASIPWLIAGGALGVVVGFGVGLFLFAPRTASAQKAVDQKYIGRGIMSIYGGLPMLLMVLSGPAFEPLTRALGDTAGAFAFLAIFLVFVALSLVLYDRLPRRMIMPLGLVGWIATFAIACWFGLRNS